MTSLLGMAGLAEAGEALGLLVFYGCLLVVVFTCALAYWRSSPIAGFVTTFLCAAVGIFFVAGSVFAEPSIPRDPDELFWIGKWRVASAIWLLCLIGCVVCWILVYRRKLARSSTSGDLADDYL